MSEIKRIRSTLTEDDGQLLLPVEIRPISEVHWFNTTKELRRRRIFGKQIVSSLVIDPETSLPRTTAIKTDDTSKVQDPHLRYTLRLQDAAETAGWYEHSPGMKSGHFVSVYATDVGFDSQLTGATYSGVSKSGVDTFMENLRRFAPDYDSDYGNL